MISQDPGEALVAETLQWATPNCAVAQLRRYGSDFCYDVISPELD